MFKKLKYGCNPYLPGKEHVPDGEPHVFGDRLYIFGSHDEIGAQRYCTGPYVGWSAPLADLTDWRYEGVILEKGQDPMDPDGTKDYYAPDAVQGPDGRYYLYYSIEGSKVLSSAVSDSPSGPYHFYGHVKDSSGHILGSEDGDAWQFDPAVLRDDDGRIWLYSGQGLPVSEIARRKVKGAMVCELENDMLTVKGKQNVITSNEENRFDENPFFEASSIRKIDGRYYFIYSPLPNTHFLCYAVSSRPDGGFTYGGVLVSNADIFPDDKTRQQSMNYWGNNHGSLLQIGEEFYIFYHKNSNHSPYARQGCVERIKKTEDGRFLQAELTSNGFCGKAVPAKGEYAAYTAWLLRKKDMAPFIPYQFLEYDENDPYSAEEDETDVPYIANLRDGSKAGFRYISFEGTESEFFIRARGSGEGEIQILADGQELVRLQIKPENVWTIYSAPCRTEKKTASLILVYRGSGSVDLLSFGMR